MAQVSSVPTTNRYAVVTGANKGIRFEICRQLASDEIVVGLTARDENKGLESIKKLKDSGIPYRFLVFHQLDVVDPNIIASLAEFIKNQFGKLDILNIPDEWAKGMLSDVEGLTEERIDEVMDQYLKDYKNNLLVTKGWSPYFSTYCITKAAVNAYTRVVAKKHSNFGVNSVCPGFCMTDITANLIGKSAAEGATYAVRLALLPKDKAPSGCFFNQNEIVDF